MKILIGLAAIAVAVAAPALAKNDNKGSGNSGGGNSGGGSTGSSGNGGGNSGGGNGSGGNGGGGGMAPSSPRSCSLADLAPGAIACSGFFAGNLLSGNSGDIAAQRNALASLGLAWDSNFANITKIGSLGGLTTVDFSTAGQNPLNRLYGDTWVGLHFGNGAGLGGNATGFYKINAGIAGISTFLLNITQGSSGATVYRTGTAPPPPMEGPGEPMGAVPEPASWAMMIAGFGLIGAVMRRRRGALA